MTNIEKVIVTQDKYVSPFDIMNDCCPSDFGLIDRCKDTTVNSMECLRCWISEVKE